MTVINTKIDYSYVSSFRRFLNARNDNASKIVATNTI